MNIIYPINALKDNYIWVIYNPENHHIILIDPGEAAPVLNYIHKNQFILDAILLTHHHWDHTAGVADLLIHYPDTRVYGSLQDKTPQMTHFVSDQDLISFPNLNLIIQVFSIPGHTLGHVAYLTENAFFSGDTLFSCGCGRVFEGTPTQMYDSLEKIKNLPLNTLIYCGHEYTLANIHFAQCVDPDNIFLEERKKQVEILIEKKLPSLPVILEIELQTNPFLRCETEVISTAVQNYCHLNLPDAISVFTHLREWKNRC